MPCEGDDNDDDTEGSEVPLDYLLKEEGLTEDEVRMHAIHDCKITSNTGML